MYRNLLPTLLLLIFSCSPLKKYQDLPEVKAWENDIVKFEQPDRTESYPNDAILFAGSSSIKIHIRYTLILLFLIRMETLRTNYS